MHRPCLCALVGIVLCAAQAVAQGTFEDDFTQDAAQWSPFLAEGEWSCAGGVLSSRGPEEYAGRLADLAPVADVVMEAEARCGDSERRNFGLVLRVQEDHTRVVVRYYDREDKLEIIHYKQDRPDRIERAEARVGLQPGAWYRFKAAAVGDTVLAKCWPAATPEPGWQLRSVDADTRPGRVGLIAHDGTHADFRQVRVAWGDAIEGLRQELEAERAAYLTRLSEQLSLEVEPTPFVLRESGLRRVLIRTVLDGKVLPIGGVLRVDFNGHETTHDVAAADFAAEGWPLDVPEPDKPAELRVTFDTEHRTRLEGQCQLHTAKPWTFYMTPHTHYDIGYTAPQPEVIDRLAGEMNDAIRFCEETADWPEGSRYRWTVEVTSLADHFAARHPEQMDRFLKLAREGRIEICGFYLNMPTELTGHEETIRCLYPAEEWRRQYGVPVDTVMIDDVPGYAWTLADLLVDAGMPRAAFRANSIRGQFLWDRPGAVPRPFYWQGPAGKRLFVWYTDSYREGNFFREPGLHEDAFLNVIRRNEATGTKVTDIQLRMGGDNLPPDLDASANARAWNEKYLWPRVVVATNREFLEIVEAKYGAEAPTVSGDIPSWWAEGPASTAAETGLNRLTHDRLVAVETLWTLVTLLDPEAEYPRGHIRQAYDHMIHFDEHTWGASGSISDPHGEATRVQWAWKAAQAQKAAALTQSLEKEGLSLFARHVPAASGDCVGVWNPMGADGEGIVALRKAEGFPVSPQVTRAVEVRTNRAAPAQWDPDTETLIFLAKDVPALGCAVYRLEAGTPATPPAEVDPNVLENDRYRLSFSPETGAWMSFYDKQLGRELLDTTAEWSGNQVIREIPQGGREAIDRKQPVTFDRTPAGPCRLVARRAGAVYQSLTFETSLPGCPRIVQTYRLLPDWLDIENTFQKEEVLDPESIAVAFPFALEKPALRAQIANAVMRPGLEQLPYSCYDFYSVQHWASVASDDACILWTPLDAPVVSFSGLNMYRWADRLTFDRGHIYSLVMNNCWTTNFHAGQQGEVRSRYRIASFPEEPSATEATALASRPFYPLLPFLPAGKADDERRGPLLAIEGDPVTVSCVKRAEDGNAIIVRLLELDGKGGERTLRLSLPEEQRITRAYAATPTEVPENDWPVHGDAVTVLIPAKGIATVSLVVE